MSSNATCSLDTIPTFLLKSCLDSLITPITNIINLSFLEGSFLTSFKDALVYPLLKKHKASLKLVRKEPSRKDKFMMLVIGVIRESRQDLRRKVGMVSREQVALEDIRMACRTSSWLVGEKVLKGGGLQEGGR